MARTVLITGASRGIGRETARQFALSGYNVVIHYHQNEEAAKSLCNELLAEPNMPDMSYRLLLAQAAVCPFSFSLTWQNSSAILQGFITVSLSSPPSPRFSFP